MSLTSLQKLKLIYVLIALTCAEDSCFVIQVSMLFGFTFCLCKACTCQLIYLVAVLVGDFLFYVIDLK
jgi:hypothetical protein